MVEKKINLGGDTYLLKYDNMAVFKIDQKLDYSAMHVVEKANKHGVLAALSLSDIATILWGGMLHKHPGLQVEQMVQKIPLRPPEKYTDVAMTVFDIIMEVYGFDDADVEISEPGNETADRGTGTGKESKK